MLNAEEKASYEAESQQLRLALKTWETAWAREHDGAKPSRDDIKQNAEIAQKYTAYNRVRGILSGKTTASEAKKDKKHGSRKHGDDVHSRRKRKQSAVDASAQQVQSTPSKRLRAAGPQMTPGHNNIAADNTVTPSISRKLFSPVVPTSIGPTPQRDGRVLGLFDVLSEEKRSAVAATPSKTLGLDKGATTEAASFALLGATPRKQTVNMDEDDDDDLENVRRLGRTPMSSGKRNLLDQFTGGAALPTTMGAAARGGGALGTTPLKSRDANIQQQQSSFLTTPSKAGPQPQFATPAFLRRVPPPTHLPPVDENGEFPSPPARLRLPRKPLVRGLSSVLAGLRKAEDDRLDAELDVLRDLENDMEGSTAVAPPRPKAAPLGSKPLAAAADLPKEGGAPAATAEVEDSQLPRDGPPQPPRLLGGFDDEALYDSPPEDQVGRDGQPLRVFKKKGQKRTTRLVRMRPTRTRRPAAGAAMAEQETDEEGGDEQGQDEVVPETQAAGEDDYDDDRALSGSEFGSDGGEGQRAEKKAAPKKDKKKKSTADGKAEGTVKKAVRKVNELAHANFKRLKLRNHGAKGGPGFKSRFRRRR